MKELAAVRKVAEPQEVLLVVDAMTGQEAVNVAQGFLEYTEITGIVMTKLDGDARGGAALSIRQITGKPIKFMGIGEKIDALEPFHPDRVASRILGMGDILSLVEEAQQKVDQDKAKKLVQKVRKGKGFDLEDLRDQFTQMEDKVPQPLRIVDSKSEPVCGHVAAVADLAASLDLGAQLADLMHARAARIDLRINNLFDELYSNHLNRANLFDPEQVSVNEIGWGGTTPLRMTSASSRMSATAADTSSSE